MGIALGIDFLWIFIDFWKQIGGKLVSKINENTAPKSIKKRMANQRHLEASRRRLGAVLADLGGGDHGTGVEPAIPQTPCPLPN